MKAEKRNKRSVKKHFQLSLRFLLFLMLVLGPLSGWYGPSAVKQVRDLLVSEPPKTITPNAPSQFRSRLRAQQKVLSERLIEQELREAQAIARRQARERAARSMERRNPLVNRNGTFNMRYHLPPSEQ